MLRQLPDESVDCVVTSPPYWGLRDYGTGSWEGGDENCDHVGSVWRTAPPGTEKQASNTGSNAVRSGDCKCGARRIDNQLGLEPTPDLYVTRMVDVFREVRRVLADHGTCWVNLGDSYASSPPGNVAGVGATSGLHGANNPSGAYRETLKAGHATKRNTIVAGLKPKDLVGIPWRLAFALQADGWYLRSDIIWSKPNPMPESVTDRPTKAHEYVFLLSKSPRYFFDQEAVREPHRREWAGENGLIGQGATRWAEQAGRNDYNGRTAPPQFNPAGRNVRSVWEIATQPFPEAHFATFPEELVRRCVLAGCPEWVCGVCSRPRERIVEREFVKLADRRPTRKAAQDGADMADINSADKMGYNRVETLGWSDCGHGNYRPGRVLDPFMGSGTTALVARNHGRHAVGIDLNASYLEMAARRLQQLSLLAEAD